MVEHKICMCYGILCVIFVLSTLELITRHLISFMVLKKKLKIVDWCYSGMECIVSSLFVWVFWLVATHTVV